MANMCIMEQNCWFTKAKKPESQLGDDNKCELIDKFQRYQHQTMPCWTRTLLLKDTLSLRTCRRYINQKWRTYTWKIVHHFTGELNSKWLYTFLQPLPVLSNAPNLQNAYIIHGMSFISLFAYLWHNQINGQCEQLSVGAIFNTTLKCLLHLFRINTCDVCGITGRNGGLCGLVY